MRKKEQQSGEMEAFLDEGTTFKGDVTFDDTLHIYGQFQGSVRSGKTLIIGESADVNAEIEVAVVKVSGRLRGSVRASERVELNPTARAECSIDCKTLVVHEGASFDGQCAMAGKDRPREVPTHDRLTKLASS